MLSLKNIAKKYVMGDNEVDALKGVSIEFRKSEFVSILGPSGCGKTTLLNIIGGLDRYTDGDLTISGVSTKKYRESDWDTYRNHSVGFVFQSYNLIPHQTVLSNVELALTLSGVSKDERRRRATEVLKKVGLGDQLKKKPNQMSGGQMQRVAIARALVNDPEILLADEPTGALDSETSVQIMEILKEISNDRLIIMVTHNPELAEEYSSRIIRLVDGRVTGDTNPYDPESDAATSAAAVLDNESEYDANGIAVAASASAPDSVPSVPQAVKDGKNSAKGNKKGKKGKKTSMSFFTALSLSLNNLMTKKARTFLTSFAGSIGIIGIALILALSTGINNYIASVQEETLASYPITITSETMDMGALMISMMNANEESKAHGKDAVYSNAVLYHLMNTMNNESIKNDLAALKVHLEKEMDREVSESELYEYVRAIVYTYNVTMNAYATDADGKYVKSDVMSLMTSLMGNMMGDSSFAGSMASMSSLTSSGFALWEQLLAPSANDKGDHLVSPLIRNEYEVLAGDWPKTSDEVVLFVSPNNEVSDLVLYSLGLKSFDEMAEIMVAVGKGEQVSTEIQSWQYDEIVGRTFKMILQSDYYQDTDKDGIYENIAANESLMNTVITAGKTLKISGIVRVKEDASFAIVSGSLGYTEELTREIIDGIANSDVVKAQIANPGYDVINGLPFYIDTDISDKEKIERFKEYCSELTNAQKRTIYAKMIGKTDEEIAAEVDAFLSQFGTDKDAMASALADMFTASMGLPDAFKETLVETFKEMSQDELKANMVTFIKSTADPEEAIRAALETPTREELDNIVAGNIAAVMMSVPNINESTAKSFLIQTYYQELTSMDAATIAGYIATLSEEEKDQILYNMAAVQYASQSMTTEQENEKIAKLFDELVATYTDEQLAAAYVKYTEISQSTFDTNIALLGVADFDDPFTINVYTSSFENKDFITEFISDYNDSVDEDHKITYTDYVGLIMSSVTTIINAISYVLIAFVSISLIVSSIMIGIITYISVLERTKEIGILRSIGASKKDITRVFNAETLIVGFSAGMIGIITTILLCFPINWIVRWLTDIPELTAVLPWQGGVLLVIISMVLTIVAGLFPSLVAAKKDPVVALRTE